MIMDLSSLIMKQKLEKKEKEVDKLNQQIVDREKFIRQLAKVINAFLEKEENWELNGEVLHFRYQFDFDALSPNPQEVTFGSFILTNHQWRNVIDYYLHFLYYQLPTSQMYIQIGYYGIHAYFKNCDIKEHVTNLKLLDQKIKELKFRLKS